MTKNDDAVSFLSRQRQQLLVLVAKTYRKAVQNNQPPAKTVQNMLGESRSTIARLIAEARDQGLLPPAQQGKITLGQEHEPRQARWSDGTSWTACKTCKQPWPCAQNSTDE